MKKRKEKRINDKGFTLVELLIAVAIIAIIVAPILDGIVTSMKVNKKSDELLNQTAIANSIMESMTNMSLEDAAVKLSNNSSSMNDFLPTDMYDADSERKEILTTIPGAAAPTPCVVETTNPDGSYNYTFTKNASNLYTFGLKNIEYDGKDYDVRVTLDARDVNATGYNDAKYVDISEYDEKYDALFSQAGDLDKQICGKMALNATVMGMSLTADDIDKEASRIIKIKIYTEDEVDINGVTHTYTKVATEYGRQVEDGYLGEGVETYVCQPYSDFYTNKEDETRQLRNLYIMFEPNYDSIKTDCKDEIIIENEENIPVTIYLIKQNNSSDNIDVAEQNYFADITSIYNSSTGENPTTIKTNLGYNLWNLLESNNYVEVLGQCRLTVENKYSNVTNVYTGSQFYQKVGKITGASNDRVRVYTKKVEVFSAGSYDAGFTGAPLATVDSVVSKTTPTPTP